MTSTFSATGSFTDTDIERVFNRVRADFVMAASSTGGWSEKEANDYAHDVELLAKKGYLAWMDLTLLSGGTEKMAVQYTVDTKAGGLTSSRPGGVLWPRVSQPRLRLIVGRTDAYNDAAQQALASKLKIPWRTNYEDFSHSGLNSSGGRIYTSNDYRMTRKDWAA